MPGRRSGTAAHSSSEAPITRHPPIAVAAVLAAFLFVPPPAHGQARERVTVSFHLTPSDGFGPVSQDTGGMVFRAPDRPGLVVVTPQADLRPMDLVHWSQRGITNSQVTLTPMHPGASREILVGRGTGSYFPVKGTLDGKPVAGFLGGVFGPGDVLRLRLLAVAPRDDWNDFRHAAEAMVASIRLEAPIQEAETLDLSPSGGP